MKGFPIILMFADMFESKGMTLNLKPRNPFRYEIMERKRRGTTKYLEKMSQKSKKIERAKRAYERNRKLYDLEEDPLTLLIWWSPPWPLMEKLDENCGGCWVTHDKSLEHQVNGIIFDNTRFKDALLHDFGGGLPDFENRNVDSQYWIFWPREAASKGIEKGMNYNQVKNWDNAFNLTARNGVHIIISDY